MANSSKKLNIRHSNYTIAKSHKKLTNSVIYSRDYMVTDNISSWDSTTMPYGESNFKFVTNNKTSQFSKHKFGNWEKCGSQGEWTRSNIESASTASDTVAAITSTENVIELKPNYTSFTDFAYFSDCGSLLELSVEDIISKFPGELCVTGEVGILQNVNGDFEYLSVNNSDSYGGNATIAGDDTGDSSATAAGDGTGDSSATVAGDGTGDSSATIAGDGTGDSSATIAGDGTGDSSATIAGDGAGDNETISSSGTLYRINNPFNIDIYSRILPNNGYEMRYLYFSDTKYEAINPSNSNSYCVNCILPPNAKNDIKCYSIAEKIQQVSISIVNYGTRPIMPIYIYKISDTEVGYYTTEEWVGWRITPIKSIKDDFFNNLTDFQKLLLNRNTTPLYTCKLKSYTEGDSGILYTTKTLTWPVSKIQNVKNGTLDISASSYEFDKSFNIDIESMEYQEYLLQLIDIANFCDEHYTNNLWLHMVHESIKNMDNYVSDDKDNDDYNEGVGVVKSLCYGLSRIGDNLKRLTDNIKYVNSITYDTYNNLPDYFLSDNLALSGWDTQSFGTYFGTTTINPNYAGESKEYTSNDTNTIFQRNLKLNSKSIFTKKGTRDAIESILALFGLRSYDFDKNNFDYKITEYVYVAENNKDTEKTGKIWTNNFYDSDEMSLVEVYDNEDAIELSRLPLTSVEIEKDNKLQKYIIPWFDKDKDYYGEYYYQMYGGWGKQQKILVSANEELEWNEVELNSDILFNETQKYLMVAKNIEDLMTTLSTQYKGDTIIYVYDISDYDGYFSSAPSSHYFINSDITNWGTQGTYTNNEKNNDGWYEIPNDNIKNGGKDGLKVRYLESLIDDNIGNNPHIGYGGYDDGIEYIERYKHFYRYLIDTEGLSDKCYDCKGDVLPIVDSMGFNMIKQVDNIKCWYFGNESLTLKEGEKLFLNSEEEDISSLKNGSELPNALYNTEISPFDYENITEEDKFTESSANSIVNVKNLEIYFQAPVGMISDFKEFINTIIYPYLTQVIPSTTILSLKFFNDDVIIADPKAVSQTN